ncbi:MAG: hypothetical protein LQ344_001525 [Seirophora lacunosa]|nr:MAG: hypothetical protein LQ344_001525 [Seirophora lacunosa]
MLLQRLLCSLFLLLTAVGALRNAGGEKILLSQVKTLTLRHRLKTSHRRVPALPQLKCIGGNARGYYDVDIMRCKNQGADYEDENIQWTCTASLPSEFKLGTTDVICEGYESSSDPYVLKGSCGVEYRLVLTDTGEQKYGHKSKSRLYDEDSDDSSGTTLGTVLFGMVFIGVLGWIVYSALVGNRAGNGNNRGGFPWGGGGGYGGGGGGGGGWFGGGGGDDAPPPYSRHPPPSGPKTYPSGRAADASSWRPGFWTGAAAGAAGAYMAGNRGQTQTPPRNGGWNWGGTDNGEGSSGGRARPSAPSSSSFSSARHSSSGFGGTSRR